MTGSINAPEFPLKDKQWNILLWLNLPTGKAGTIPITLESLKGKVVLVDFWTYSCINCQKTLPFLQKWWDKYKDSGLVIIGVHTPEFEFEKDPKNVEEALKKYGVSWPVVLDNDNQIWEAYANHYWPAKYLVDAGGKIIYNHFGEGNYIETELKIQSALKDAGFKVSDQIVSETENQSGALWKTQTPELYFGSLRGVVENIPSDISLADDQIYSIGKWDQETEYLQHNRTTEDIEDLVILKYRAKEVFLVMASLAEDSESRRESASGEPLKVYVTLDGVPLTEELAGKDVQFDSEDRAFVEVQFATLYNIISSKTFGDHTIRLSTTSDQLRLFAFTFGS